MLRDSHMLQKLPCGMRRAFGLAASQLRGKITQGSIEINVSLMTSHAINHLGPKLSDLRLIHGFSVSTAVRRSYLAGAGSGGGFGAATACAFTDP